MLLKLAFRNVFRNLRRTLLVMSMIIGGFCALVIFRGFAHNMNWTMSDTVIRTQFGHLQIMKQAVLDNATVDIPKEKLLDETELLTKMATSDPDVLYASGRISFYGLLTADEKSTSAMGLAFDGKIETQMRDSMKVIDGHNLSFEKPMEVILGSGIQQRLKLKIGDNITALAQTFSGSINAIDLELVGVFQSGISEVDNTTFILPLKAAQKLLDTDDVERLVITTASRDKVDGVRDRLKASLSTKTDIVVKTWWELADLYRKVEEFYRVQNLIVGIILLSLTFLGILNTAGMAVFERTGEIGTTRALGSTAGDIVKLFTYEGAALGLISCLIAIPVSFLVITAINAIAIPIEVPGASLALVVKIDIFWDAYRDAFLTCSLTSIFATMIPAYKSTKLSIVDALRRSI